jgi:hypothetical protein
LRSFRNWTARGRIAPGEGTSINLDFPACVLSTWFHNRSPGRGRLVAGDVIVASEKQGEEQGEEEQEEKV